MFVDRHEAGQRLGEFLRDRLDPGARVVLGIPRGGVVVAAEVARVLGAPLDISVPRKIGAPDDPEFAVGAVALAGEQEVRLVDDATLRAFDISEEYVAVETERQKEEIRRRLELYRGARAPLELAGCTAVLIDDGVATGLTARAAARALALAGARETIIAVPVAPADALESFRREGLRLEALEAPVDFRAVGRFYDHFEPVADEVVQALLGVARQA